MKTNTNDEDRLLSVDEVAFMMNRSKKTLWRWWSIDQSFPKPIIVNGRALGWRKSTIERFFETGDIGL